MYFNNVLLCLASVIQAYYVICMPNNFEEHKRISTVFVAHIAECNSFPETQILAGNKTMGIRYIHTVKRNIIILVYKHIFCSKLKPHLSRDVFYILSHNGFLSNTVMHTTVSVSVVYYIIGCLLVYHH